MPRNAYHSHKGQDTAETRYYPERKFSWRKHNNPHGYTCQWCGKVIKWLYRNGVLWSAPRAYCDNHICQNVRAARAQGIEDQHVADWR